MRQDSIICDNCGRVTSAIKHKRDLGWLHLKLDVPREISRGSIEWDYCGESCLLAFVWNGGLNK